MKILPILLVLTFCISDGKSAESCEKAALKFTKNVATKPTGLLPELEKAMVEHPGCECEIVKSAVVLADADKKLIGQIVSIAANVAPAESATIAECALAAAPEASAEIKSSLEEVFEGAKAPVASSKQGYGSKEPVPASKEVIIDDSEDFVSMPKAVSGVYLIAPVSPAGGGQIDRLRLARELGISVRELDRILKNGGSTLVEILRRRPRGDRDRDPRDESTPTQQTKN
jgi:hypothetical protein